MMTRFKDILGRNGTERVLRRRSPEEPNVIPYVPQPPMPLAAPPAVPHDVSSFIPEFGDPDLKLDLSATYSPGSMSAGPFPVAPPGYVSREPSTTTPPDNVAYERPVIPASYRHTSVPTVHIPPTHVPPAPTPTAHYGHRPMPSASAPAPPPAQFVHFEHAARPSVPPPAIHFEHPPTPSSPVPSIPSIAHHRGVQTPAPGDLPLERALGQKITPEELRELREMIRERYQLDLLIWRERFLRPRDRDITQIKIRKADALMNKIRRTVITWDRPEYFEHGTGDYEAFQEIARRIHLPGKRDWVNEPPWMPERRMY